jgi:hypothetical protein
MEPNRIPTDSGQPGRIGVLPVAIGVVIAGLIAYFNSFFGEFLYDDIYIIDNADRLWPPVALWGDTSAVLWATFSIHYVLDGFYPGG